jgi:hypothetical protein
VTRTTPRTLRIHSTLRTPSTRRTSASVAANISARRKISDRRCVGAGDHNEFRSGLQQQVQLLQVLLNRQDLLTGDVATAAWPLLVLEDHA